MFIKTGAAAKMAGVGRKAVRKAIDSGDLPAFRVNPNRGHHYVREADAQAWANEIRQKRMAHTPDMAGVPVDAAKPEAKPEEKPEKNVIAGYGTVAMSAAVGNLVAASMLLSMGGMDEMAEDVDNIYLSLVRSLERPAKP